MDEPKTIKLTSNRFITSILIFFIAAFIFNIFFNYFNYSATSDVGQSLESRKAVGDELLEINKSEVEQNKLILEKLEKIQNDLEKAGNTSK